MVFFSKAPYRSLHFKAAEITKNIALFPSISLDMRIAFI